MRDSTALPGFGDVVDWLLATALAAAVVVALAGVDFKIGGLAVRSHGAGRVIIVSLALLALRWRVGIAAILPWLTRIALLTAITGSVLVWFRFLLTTIGGADSYGYVSASQLIANGRLAQPAPVAEWLSAANRLALASPLGWAPAADGAGIVPTYPLGLPFVMAAFSMLGGEHAVFFVSPVVSLISLLLVYRVARDWFDAEVALLAVAILAWNPVFLTYAKQPMSDALATTWVMLAILMGLRRTVVSAFAGGLAAGAAVITRPALLVAAAMIPFLSFRGDARAKRFIASGIGAAVGVVIQMMLQATLFGSPLASGYGPTAGLFAWSHVSINVAIFAKQTWYAFGPIWLMGLVIGLIVTPRELRWRLLAVFAAVTAPYLFWLPFDHWETLRFLLPALAPLSIVVAAGFMRIIRPMPNRYWLAAMPVLLTLVVVGRSAMLLRDGSQFAIQKMEARYPLAGEWVNINTPANSVVMANQHSGSLRWYGRRQTIRWDFLDPGGLKTTVRELQSHGATVYVALEGNEVAMFDQRFQDVIGQLQVDHVGSIRNVSFRRLLAAE